MLFVGTSPSYRLDSVAPIRWGEKCICGQPDVVASVCETCWCKVRDVYRFSEAKFLHLYVHQQWIEGVFNILSQNEMNTSAPLVEAKAASKMNKTGAEHVEAAAITQKEKLIKEETTRANKDMNNRHSNWLDEHAQAPPTRALTKKP